ncbi:NADH-quinone oxidoreductase subunit L [Skermanella sp. TT6]|uniref:Probable inorganic carbon transporter subunit DabB n=1 Tax=Skermanella cutis TaxID=2775420 RepID=A0ABX7BBN7_9PROT|nr:NADH-quinone oxidoreductase subunit L [Skermanella sp. TT6]QQP91810.1 NADH-quinone oxidoreductase subunit L [Skermanella sp. TT6]
MHTSLLWLCAAGPLLLIAVAMPSLSSPAPSSDRTRRSTAGPAFAASLAALAVALAAAAAWAVHGTLRTGTFGIGGVGFGIYLDGLTAVMLVLVAFVGAVVIRYSARYLDGDPNHARFMGWLALTLAAVLLLIVSGNLFQFALAWVGTSVGLHRLLVFYAERPAAVLAARKKFLASRIGDVCLIGAMVLIHQVFGSLDYAGIFAGADALRASGTDAVHSAPVHGIALLLVVAALLKSAQFPLHGWLTEVMETPTPVSALLHAGIINAGGFLVLRLADVISLSMPSLHLLAVVGGLTALFGSVVMLTQTSVKVSLAYSTIAQMGFMMLQCGLGAYSAALLHIVAHSLYKAHAFLSSGSVIDIARASWSPSPGGRLHPARMTMAVAAVLATVLVIGTLSGASLAEKPGVFALGAIMLFGLVHLIAGAIDERPTGYVIGRAAALAVLVATAYFALQVGAERLLAGSLPAVQGPGSPLDYAIVAAVVLGFGALTVFQNLMPRHAGEPRWQALHVHIANGFYVNTIANRLVLRLWPSLPPGRSASQAATSMNGAHR